MFDDLCVYTEVDMEDFDSFVPLITMWEMFTDYQGINTEYDVHLFVFPTFLPEDQRIILGFNTNSLKLTHIAYPPLDFVIPLTEVLQESNKLHFSFST